MSDDGVTPSEHDWEAHEREHELRMQALCARARAKYDSGDPLFTKPMISQALQQMAQDPLPDELELLDIDGVVQTVEKPVELEDKRYIGHAWQDKLTVCRHTYKGLEYGDIHSHVGGGYFNFGSKGPLLTVRILYHSYGNSKTPLETYEEKEQVSKEFEQTLRDWRTSEAWREVEAHIRSIETLPHVDKIIGFGLAPLCDYHVSWEEESEDEYDGQSVEARDGHSDADDTMTDQKEPPVEVMQGGSPLDKSDAGSQSNPTVRAECSNPSPEDLSEEDEEPFGIDLARRRSRAQHCLLITLAELFSELQRSPVSIVAQEPRYFSVCQAVLRDHGVDAIAGYGEAFLLVDESSVVVSCCPDIAVRQIVADLSKPAAMVWGTMDVNEEDDFNKEWQVTEKYRIRYVMCIAKVACLLMRIVRIRRTMEAIAYGT